MKPQRFKIFVGTLFVGAFLAIAPPSWAQFTPSIESLSDMYPGKAYSPYAERNFPDRVCLALALAWTRPIASPAVNRLWPQAVSRPG